MAEIKVITIGRHYCAGGSTIGKLVAEKLGIPCYDREIIDMAAQKSGIAMSEIQKYEEAALSILKTPINLFSKEKEYPITEKIFAAETEVIMACFKGKLRYRGQMCRFYTEKQSQDAECLH